MNSVKELQQMYNNRTGKTIHVTHRKSLIGSGLFVDKEYNDWCQEQLIKLIPTHAPEKPVQEYVRFENEDVSCSWLGKEVYSKMVGRGVIQGIEIKTNTALQIDFDSNPNIQFYSLGSAFTFLTTDGHPFGKEMVKAPEPEYVPFDKDDFFEISKMLGSDIGVTLIEGGKERLGKLFSVSVDTFDLSIGIGNPEEDELGLHPVMISTRTAFKMLTIDGHPFGKEQKS